MLNYSSVTTEFQAIFNSLFLNVTEFRFTLRFYCLYLAQQTINSTQMKQQKKESLAAVSPLIHLIRKHLWCSQCSFP